MKKFILKSFQNKTYIVDIQSILKLFYTKKNSSFIDLQIFNGFKIGYAYKCWKFSFNEKSTSENRRSLYGNILQAVLKYVKQST